MKRLTWEKCAQVNNSEGLYRQPLMRFDQTLKRQDKLGSALNKKRNLFGLSIGNKSELSSELRSVLQRDSFRIAAIHTPRSIFLIKRRCADLVTLGRVEVNVCL